MALELTPGVRFLLRALPRTLLSPLLVYALLHHLRTRTNIPAQLAFLSPVIQKLKLKNIDLKWFLALYYPTAFLLTALSMWVKEELQARRMGAMRVPAASGKWIGNLDLMLRIAQSQEKKLYLGEL